MPLTSPSRSDRGETCGVCGGRDCSKFTTHDWDGDPFRPGTREQMTEAAEQAKKAEESPAPVRARGRRARRPAEDRAHHGPGEDR